VLPRAYLTPVFIFVGLITLAFANYYSLCSLHYIPSYLSRIFFFLLPFLHLDQGSAFTEVAPVREALKLAMQLAVDTGLCRRPHWVICPGGGLGVPYHEDDDADAADAVDDDADNDAAAVATCADGDAAVIAAYGRLITDALTSVCAELGVVDAVVDSSSNDSKPVDAGDADGGGDGDGGAVSVCYRPTLVLEPGRSLIARAGVAVYDVGSVKRRLNQVL
jgi:diaminopimelate decarboxylase